MDNVIEAIKEFFFDIVGYLIPGVIVLLIGKVVFKLPIDLQESNVTINMIVGYTLGYLIFALSQIKESWLKKMYSWSCIPKKLKTSSEDQVIADLSGSDTFVLASNKIKSQTTEGDLQLKSFKSFRNFAMSNTPEADKKVYTFMFRADLSNHLHTISVIVLFLLFLNYLTLSIPQMENLGIKNISYGWFILFLIAVLVLRKGWKRFYRIAMSIPFSIYIEKNKNSQHE